MVWVATAIQRSIRDPRAIPELIALLEHENPLRQIQAANTLSTVGDNRAIELLKRSQATRTDKKILDVKPYWLWVILDAQRQ
ncbi:MAG: HEAT repeat domain-containing protein [Ardenticatenaceae bacterium]|nr:HEAT repeat domain-containing protein [Ardenticatenaceae bacterium]